MSGSMPPIEDLVPHSGRMGWLSRVLSCEGDELVAEAVIGPEHLLLRDDGRLSAATGIEYMAQAVAAWAGVQQQRQGGKPKIGFLLGTRRYRCAVSHFEVGEVLSIRVNRQFQADNGLGQFDAQISRAGVEIASAQLNVFGPEDPLAFLRQTA